MIQLFVKEKVTGAFLVENFCEFDKFSLYTFLVRVDKMFQCGFDYLLFWFETSKKGTDYAERLRGKPKSNSKRGKRKEVAG